MKSNKNLGNKKLKVITLQRAIEKNQCCDSEKCKAP